MFDVAMGLEISFTGWWIVENCSRKQTPACANTQCVCVWGGGGLWWANTPLNPSPKRALRPPNPAHFSVMRLVVCPFLTPKQKQWLIAVNQL